MAKDTEKLIRQLSLISYLMAERRPVTALEIRRDVEGYSGMNEDAFARRFYADRAELESLGIQLTVDKPADGVAEQENYSLRPENFHLPAIEFTDAELAGAADRAVAARRRVRLRRAAAPRAAADLLGPPEPAAGARPAADRARHHRLGRRPRPLAAPGQGRDGDLPPQDDHLRLLHDGARRGGGAEGRPLPPALPGRAVLPRRPQPRARRDARLPPLAHPRQGRLRDEGRARLPAGPTDVRPARLRQPRRVAVRRRRSAPPRSASPSGSPGRSSATSAATGRSSPPRAAASCCARRTPTPASSWPGSSGWASTRASRGRPSCRRARRRARRAPGRAPRARRSSSRRPSRAGRPSRPRRSEPAARREAAIRPERFARLVTLASILIEAGRAGERLRIEDVRERLQVSDQELQEDINVLNVVNFGGGSYVLYAEVGDDGWIEVDPEPYSDNFARPARLLPVEAKALVAAIDLIGEHMPEGALTQRAREDRRARSARTRWSRACRSRTPAATTPKIARVVSQRDRRPPAASSSSTTSAERGRVLRAGPSSPTRSSTAARAGTSRPSTRARTTSATSAWTASRRSRCRPSASSRGPRSTRRPTSTAGRAPARSSPRAWPACGSRPSARAGSARSAPWPSELADGSIVVEVPFKGIDWLVKEVLEEAGDAAVLEPEDARAAVARAVGRLRGVPVGAG